MFYRFKKLFSYLFLKCWAERSKGFPISKNIPEHMRTIFKRDEKNYTIPIMYFICIIVIIIPFNYLIDLSSIILKYTIIPDFSFWE